MTWRWHQHVDPMQTNPHEPARQPLPDGLRCTTVWLSAGKFRCVVRADSGTPRVHIVNATTHQEALDELFKLHEKGILK